MKKSLLALSFAALIFASPAMAADHHVEIVNKSGLTLKHFYASVTSADSWEEDILGKDTLDNGESFNVDINDGSNKCHYDFKGVFDNGAEHVQNNINVCEVSTFTYTK
jgi:opacity protein-like surface antigen